MLEAMSFVLWISSQQIYYMRGFEGWYEVIVKKNLKQRLNQLLLGNVFASADFLVIWLSLNRDSFY